MTLRPARCLRRWSLLPARQIRTALRCTMAPSLAAMPAFILAGRITIVQQLVGFSGSISCNSKEHRIEYFQPIEAGLDQHLARIGRRIVSANVHGVRAA